MVAFKNVGYREATVQKREMTIGELRHRIIKAMLKNNERKYTVLCLDNAESVTISNIDEAVDWEWHDGCTIEVINTPHTWGTKEADGSITDGNTIIMIQLKENGEPTVF